MAAELSYAAVVAHPDDDAYGMAGTVALHAVDPDFRFILIHATNGGAGDIREGTRFAMRHETAHRENPGQVNRVQRWSPPSATGARRIFDRLVS